MKSILCSLVVVTITITTTNASAQSPTVRTDAERAESLVRAHQMAVYLNQVTKIAQSNALWLRANTPRGFGVVTNAATKTNPPSVPRPDFINVDAPVTELMAVHLQALEKYRPGISTNFAAGRIPITNKVIRMRLDENGKVVPIEATPTNAPPTNPTPQSP